MTTDEHRARHRLLYEAVDELLADYLCQSASGVVPRALFDFITWSKQQTDNPTPLTPTEMHIASRTFSGLVQEAAPLTPQLD